MHPQTEQREERLLEAVPDPELTLETGVVAVVPGAGNRRLFESYGATRVIEGGQTMNPSTADILAAIEATPATEVLVLPNNSNVILTRRAGRRARVEAGARDPVPLGAGRARRDRRATSRRTPPRRTRRRCSRRWSGRDRRGHDRLARRELDGVAVRKGAFLGLADGDAVASSAELRRGRRRRRRAPARERRARC